MPAAKEFRWPLVDGKGRETNFPLEPLEETSIADTLILAQGDSRRTSDLGNYKSALFSKPLCNHGV